MTQRDDQSDEQRRLERASALYEHIQQDIEAERGPLAWLRNRSTPVRLALWTTTAGAVWFGLRAFKGTDLSDAFPSIVGLALIVGAVMAVALRPNDDYRPSRGQAVALLATGAAFLAVLVGARETGLVLTRGCVVAGLLTGIPVFVVGLLLDRDPPRGLGLTALAAGLSGGLMVQGACGDHHAGHLLLQHFGIAMVGTLVFTLVGHLLYRHWRS